MRRVAAAGQPGLSLDSYVERGRGSAAGTYSGYLLEPNSQLI